MKPYVLQTLANLEGIVTLPLALMGQDFTQQFFSVESFQVFMLWLGAWFKKGRNMKSNYFLAEAQARPSGQLH